MLFKHIFHCIIEHHSNLYMVNLYKKVQDFYIIKQPWVESYYLILSNSKAERDAFIK